LPTQSVPMEMSSMRNILHHLLIMLHAIIT